MNLTMRNLSLVFVAGCWGALLNSLAVWLFGVLGIAPALGVHIAPPLTPAFLYPRLVWGGLWGFLFLLPLGRTVISGPRAPLQPGPHPGATLSGISPQGPQRRFGPAVRLSHPRIGSVLQCHLGAGRGPVAEMGAVSLKGSAPLPLRHIRPPILKPFGAWQKIFYNFHLSAPPDATKIHRES